jgi:hypothetical protein
VSTTVSGQKCSNCHVQASLTSLTVRLYVRRSQWNYHYRCCQECVRVLKSLLWAGADNATGGMFDPPNAANPVTRVR